MSAGRAARALARIAPIALAACAAFGGSSGDEPAIAPDGGTAAADGGSAVGRDGGGASSCGATVDLASDPENCGRCGRSCLGSRCDQGACAPEVVVAAAHASDVLLVGDSIYWPSVDGTIKRLATRGSGTPQVVVEAQDVGALASDGRRLFWAERRPTGAIRACSLDACAGDATTLVADEPTPHHMTVAGDQLFWTTTPGSGVGNVVRAAKDGSARTVLAQGEEFPRFIATDDANVYWLSTCKLRYVPRGGGIAAELPSVAGCKRSGLALAPDGARFVAEQGPAILARVAANGEVAVVKRGVENPDGVAVDEHHLYWLDLGRAPPTSKGALRRLALGDVGRDVEPEVLAEVRGDPGLVVRVGKEHVFFTTVVGGEQSIVRVAK